MSDFDAVRAAMLSGNLGVVSELSDKILARPGDGPQEEENQEASAPEGEQTEVSDIEVAKTESESPAAATVTPSSQPGQTGRTIEKVAFTDHNGRQEIEIDFSDLPKMKKLASYALGANKWKVERDQLREEAKKNQETIEQFSKLNEIWGDGGVEGVTKLVNTLLGDEAGLDKLIAVREEEKRRLAAMDPMARARLEMEQERLKDRIAYEKQLGQLTAAQKAAQEKEEQAQLKQLESKAQRSFSEFNFTGKLGNEATEKRLNRAVWEDALTLLEEKGITSPTQAQLNKAFKEVFEPMSKSFETIITKNAEKVVEKTKANAEKTAASMASGTKRPGQASVMDAYKTDKKALLLKMLTGN